VDPGEKRADCPQYRLARAMPRRMKLTEVRRAEVSEDESFGVGTWHPARSHDSRCPHVSVRGKAGQGLLFFVGSARPRDVELDDDAAAVVQNRPMHGES